MTPEQFSYWLQGFVEMNPEAVPTEAQWKMIMAHLATVFTKITPPLDPIPSIPWDERSPWDTTPRIDRRPWDRPPWQTPQFPSPFGPGNPDSPWYKQEVTCNAHERECYVNDNERIC